MGKRASDQDLPPGQEAVEPTSAATNFRLLTDHAKAKRRGSGLLNRDSECHVRRAIRAAARPPDPPSPRPRWDAEEGQLWLGTELLHEFDKSAPAIAPVLDAFEAARWTREPLPIPLPREPNESDEEFRTRTENTLKNLNQKVKNPGRKRGQPILHFRLTRDRKRVRWELVQEEGGASHRRRYRHRCDTE